MDNNKQHLFKDSSIQKLITQLNAIANRDAKIVRSDRVNKNHYCNYLTGLARLLSFDEICGCFYLKDGNFLLSTNRRGSRQGETRRETSKKILDLVRSDFSESKKNDFFNFALFQMIQRRFDAKYSSTIISNILNSDGTTNTIAEKLSNLFLKKGKDSEEKKNISIKEFQEIIDFIISEKHKNKEKQDSKFVFFLSEIMILFEDINFIVKKDGLEAHREIVEFINNKGDDWANRYDKGSNSHCELAALERENQEESIEKVVERINFSIEKKGFTVSKFCCLLCFSVFDSIKENSDGKLDKFSLLGNSCAVYSGYKNVLVDKTQYSDRLIKTLNSKIEEISSLIKENKYSLLTQNENFIENSEYIEWVNEDIIPEQS